MFDGKSNKSNLRDIGFLLGTPTAEIDELTGIHCPKDNSEISFIKIKGYAFHGHVN